MIKRHIGFSVFCMLLVAQALAQPTVGLIAHEAGSLDSGYVLFSPLGSNNTYLIDKCGRLVQTWASNYKPGQSCYVLEDGTLLRPGNANNATFTAGGKGGIIEKIDWNGNVTWSYTLSDANQCQHHDVKALPNGHVLVISWESKTNIEATDAGRDPALVPATVWSEKILEIEPTGLNSGNIVWEWHLWDHLVQDFDSTKANFGAVATNAQLVDINYNASATNKDWIHLNAIDYNPDLDQILLSVHSFNEVWIIDHSTSTLAASGHSGGNSNQGGDLLYRWGNPRAYGLANATQLFGQHNAQWIPAGYAYANQIIIFNNGNGRTGGNHSTVDIIEPPVQGYNYTVSLPYLPAALSWTYNAGNPNNLYAQNISGAQLLSNGNVLICNGPAGTFSEVDATGTQQWRYINPVSNTGILNQGSTPAQINAFRCTYYAQDYAGFSGQSLIAGNILENTNSVSDACQLISGTSESDTPMTVGIYPNPSNAQFTLSLGAATEAPLQVELYALTGKLMLVQTMPLEATRLSVAVTDLAAGMYVLRMRGANLDIAKPLIIAR